MKNINAEISEKLKYFYNKNSFFEDPLHESCENAKKCWERLKGNIREESKWNYFSLPYIGKSYKGELVCVGLNVHEGGGRNLQELQIRGIKAFKTDKIPHKNDKYGYKYNPGVIESFETRCKRTVDFRQGMEEAVKKGDLDKLYRGTILWHRIAVNSKILLDGYSSNVADNFKELAKIFERMIYMDVIKCSPANVKSEKTERSKPTGKMKKLCPKYIFFKELEIIKPDNILIMSKPVAKLMGKVYKPVGDSKDFPGNGEFDYCQMVIGGKKINVYNIIHPGARGSSIGSRPELFQEFAKFLKEQAQ